MISSARVLSLVMIGLVACGGPEGGEDAATPTPDAGPAPECVRASDCDDGDFCNGSERCTAGACEAGTPPECPEGACDSDLGRCLDACEVTSDADGDGHASAACGGPDCDDADAERHPDAPEVCGGVDDDCDESVDEGAAGEGTRLHCAACDDRCQFECGDDECERSLAIGSGAHHTCAIGTQGSVRCWGANEAGQLGDGTTEDRAYAVAAIERGALSPAPTLVAAGAAHTCVSDGAGVLCWGANDHGQLGLGHTDVTRTPTRVTVPEAPVHALAAGGNVTCVVAGATRNAYCWGEDMILAPAVEDALSPTRVTHLEDVRGIAVGLGFVCGLESTHTVSCWGQSGYGNLGDDSDGFVATPVVRTGFMYLVELVAGDHFVCALRGSDGVLLCWGDDQYGQLGDGDVASGTCPRTSRCSAEPVQIGFGSQRAAYAFAGGGTACAITATSSVFCWGDDRAGQIADGGSTTIHAPTLFSSVLEDEVVALGAAHLCRRRRAYGDVFCQGSDARGAIGDGAPSSGYANALVVPPPE